MSLNNVEYVTIDFETANANLTSACSVGLVGARKGQIVFEKYYLINPNEPFNSQNIAIHGITPEIVAKEKTFPEIWDEIYELIDGNIVFAHAASFDMSVLKSLIEKYNLKYPNIKIGCTLRVSRIAFKEILTSFKLSNISKYLEIEHNHHNAISDASICYYLLERCKRMYQTYDVNDLFEELGLCFGVLNQKTYRNCYVKLKETEPVSHQLEGKIFSFTGKPSKTTKNDIKKIITSKGGLYSKEITRVINSFIIFPNPSKKHLEALKNIQEKKHIDVYTEEEFFKIIND